MTNDIASGRAPFIPQAVAEADWYELVSFADGITLIHEPWIKPFYRCNMWHVRGRERDLLIDSGLGRFSLRRNLRLLERRDIVAVASHAHFDHIGSLYEFDNRLVHSAEAHILADPRPEWTLANPYATDEMFYAPPVGWNSADYTVQPAASTGRLSEGDVVDLGDRQFRVMHTPGHSPGGLAFYEEATRILISADIVYDGPLVDTAFHSDRRDYVASLQRLAQLQVSIVHGGHFPSFGQTRLRQLISDYIAGVTS